MGADPVLMTHRLHRGPRSGVREEADRWRGWTLLLLQLLHPVQGAAGAEPLDLGLVEGVVQEDGLLSPVGMLDDAFQGL